MDNLPILIEEVSDSLRCKVCNKPISISSRLGYCRSCAYEKTEFTEGKKCTFCGARLRNTNKTMCCQVCRGKHFIKCRASKKYQYHVKDIPEKDIVQFESGNGLYEHKCRYPACRKVFYSDNKFIRYCSDKCRNYHYNNTEEGHAFIGDAWLRREKVT